MKPSQLAAYVDLSRKKVAVEPVPEHWRRYFLGGRGVNMYLLSTMVDRGTNPLGPENPLVVGVGLLTGISALGSGRCNISARSPLTNALGDSNVGGLFAVTMRRTGIDFLIVTGKAEKPVRIHMHDRVVEIVDGRDLWGLDAFETQEEIRKAEGGGVQSLVIGQAGENLVRYACVRTGRKSSAGRTGMGAVMGSKNLKAISAVGEKSIEWHDMPSLQRLCKQMVEKIMSTRWAQAQSVHGTAAIFNYTYHTGLLRVRNFQTQALLDVGTLEPENIEPYKKGMSGCSACSIKCRHVYELDDGPFPHTGEGPEYSQLGSFGTMVGINRMEDVMNATYLCNKYGLDTIEVGNMIAWVMELYEKNLIPESMLDGLKPEWGSAEAVYNLIQMIAMRRGLGDILAEGMKPAVEKLGPETGYYAIHIKGMGILLSDDRAVPSFALGLATATRGGDHLRSRPAIDLYGLPKELLTSLYQGEVSSDYTSYDGKARMVWWHELQYAVGDSLGLCRFQMKFISVHAPSYDEWVKLIKHATGMETSTQELMMTGERILAVERMLNNRLGFSRKHDTLPERYYVEPTVAGLPKVRGRKIDRQMFEQMLDEYYRLHGWDENGVPKRETLEKLGLIELPLEHAAGELR
ncbi:MAG: aldehyde ferredoxin oxidoreductase family protein [Candidatus Caldarchaeum sp.]